MKSLGLGVHDIDVPRLYDWGSGSVSSTRLVVGSVPLPSPEKDYYIDFSYTVPDGIDKGVIAMAKFEATAQAYQAFEHALTGLGMPPETICDRNVLYCKSAAFHEDGAFNTIFATALWHGESGDVLFPRLGVMVHMAPGTYLMFDSREPHCFLRPGRTEWVESEYEDARYSHFLNFDMDRLAPEVREFFDLRESAAKPQGATSVAGLKVCPQTGAYVR